LDGGIRPDCANDYRGNVIYLSTFSKTLAPGIRLAWVVAPPEVIRKLVQAKQGTDLHTATFNQVVAYEVGHGGFIDQHVREICELYRHRRDVMIETLEETMPPGVHWTHPHGGLFLWATVPEDLDMAVMFAEAVKKKVAYVPGASFHPCGGGQNTMRLNFSYSRDELIQEGIVRLASVLAEQIKLQPA
ncbi:MAG TPA: PLP-dependent aminotransferase family protein, partial [Anaerolineaceae bacterium]